MTISYRNNYYCDIHLSSYIYFLNSLADPLASDAPSAKLVFG